MWQGQPLQGFRLQPGDAFAIPFSILWLLAVAGIGALILTDNGAEVDPFAYVVIPVFLGVGLFMAFGRFLIDIRGRAKTHYLLTNRRAIIVKAAWREVRRTVNLASTPEIGLRKMRSGRGSIMFGNPSPFYGMLPASWPGASQFLPPSFDIIDDAEKVYQLALDAQRDVRD